MTIVKKLIAALGFMLLFAIGSQAQESYFQQEVNYNIHVSLNDTSHFLHGNVEIQYINNSPDTLTFIWMHLWPNAYANNETALGKEKLKSEGIFHLLENEETRGFIDSIDFTVNQHSVYWEYHPEHIDICKIQLREGLKPGEQITISSAFRVKIPDGQISRLGRNGQMYSITQWYPKPAVYDQFGWHEMPYIDMGEFFSEFGTYDVYITIPKNYRVAATGNLHNQDELEWLDSLAQLNLETTNLDTLFPSATETKTLHYSESNVHDFAWFADKQYHVQKSEVEIPTGEMVTTWTFFPDKSKRAWKNSTSYVNDAVYYYSKWNGAYPYKNCTALEGPLTAGGGMEYPTITVIGSFRDTMTIEEVIMHEVGHNWFYGFLGNNERKYPYLDEGINTANEQRYMDIKYPRATLETQISARFIVNLFDIDKVSYWQFKEMQYLINEKRNYDVPLNLPATAYTEMNYGVLVYAKSANMFNHLRQYLGDETYDMAFHDYYTNHVFQHVYPTDVVTSFNKSTVKDLNWFFTDWLSTTNRSDYAIKKTNDTKVLAKNSGMVESPFLLQAVKDSVVVASKWVDGFEGKQWVDLGTSDYDAVYIDKESRTYDFDRHNNYLKNKGLLKTMEPLKLQLLSGFDFQDRTEIYYLPFVTYTAPGGLMPGIKLHNKSIYQKIVSYELTPMFSLEANELMGSAKLDFFFPLPSSFIRNIRWNNIGLQYPGMEDRHIQKLSSELQFELREPLTNNHEFYVYTINTLATPVEEILSDVKLLDEMNFFNNSGFTYRNISKRAPYRVNADLETMSFSLLTVEKFTLNADIQYKINTKKSVFVHMNSRTILGSPNISPYYGMQLMGTNGASDYKYDYLFFDRFRGAGSMAGNQFINNGAGFSVWSPEGFSDSWMHSMNMTYTLHTFLRPYLNAAAYKYNNDKRIAYEVGLQVGVKDIVEVYFPLYFSEEFISDPSAETLNIYDNYTQHIRFMLNLNKLNVFDLIRSIPY